MRFSVYKVVDGVRLRVWRVVDGVRFELKKPLYTVTGFTSKTDYVFMSIELLLILSDFYLVRGETEVC